MKKRSKNQKNMRNTYKDILLEVQENKSKNITTKEIVQVLRKVRSLNAYESAKVTSAISSILPTRIVVKKAVTRPMKIVRKASELHGKESEIKIGTTQEIAKQIKQYGESIRVKSNKTELDELPKVEKGDT